MRVCRDENGACYTATLIARDLTEGIKISMISFQLVVKLKSTIWSNCLHVWTGSSDSAVSLSLHQILGSWKKPKKNISFWIESEPPASPNCEHVTLMWIIMLPSGPGSGKTLPYVACACFPFKIYESISCSCSQIRADMVPDHVWNSTAEFFCFHAVFLFVDLPKYFPQPHTCDGVTGVLPCWQLL